LIGYTLHAKDGEIGMVEEFYFDDRQWVIRYLVVRTGSWLFGRKVLISPQALGTVDCDYREFPTMLTRDQVRKSPDIDTDKPVSRQQEELLYAHYPWQGYWNGAFAANGVRGFLQDAEVRDELLAANEERPGGDPHLRSTQRVEGYHIHADDGEIGALKDLLVDDANWQLHFLVVKTGTWIHPDNVLLSTKWITAINWADSTIRVDISVERVKESRPYLAGQYVDSPYEQAIFDHYGKPISKDKEVLHLK
jgi:uncharacterized protein YrrD